MIRDVGGGGREAGKPGCGAIGLSIIVANVFF